MGNEEVAKSGAAGAEKLITNRGYGVVAVEVTVNVARVLLAVIRGVAKKLLKKSDVGKHSCPKFGSQMRAKKWNLMSLLWEQQRNVARIMCPRKQD
jgi:hypothetical protein